MGLLETKRREFGVEIGRNLDITVLGEILGGAMDKDSMERLGDVGASIKDYAAVKIRVENRHSKLQSRAAGRAMPKYSDKMVYGVGSAPPAQLPARACPDGGCSVHPTNPVPLGLADPAAFLNSLRIRISKSYFNLRT